MHLKLSLVNVEDQFHYTLQYTITKISNSEQFIICEDWNAHIGSHSTAFERCMVGKHQGKQTLTERNC